MWAAWLQELCAPLGVSGAASQALWLAGGVAASVGCVSRRSRACSEFRAVCADPRSPAVPGALWLLCGLTPCAWLHRADPPQTRCAPAVPRDGCEVLAAPGLPPGRPGCAPTTHGRSLPWQIGAWATWSPLTCTPWARRCAATCRTCLPPWCPWRCTETSFVSCRVRASPATLGNGDTGGKEAFGLLKQILSLWGPSHGLCR